VKRLVPVSGAGAMDGQKPPGGAGHPEKAEYKYPPKIALRCSFVNQAIMENVLLEKDGYIAVVKLNREKTLNSLDMQTFEDLGNVFDQVTKDRSIRVIIITGTGKAFSSGLDLSVMETIHKMDNEEFQVWLRYTQERVYNILEDTEKPTIAAINGHAIGGGFELALACDIRISVPEAKFGLPEVNFGLVPDLGGAQRLTRLTNPGIAKELIFSGRLIDANEAYRLGIVNSIVEKENLIEAAKKLIDNKAPIAISLAKTMVNKAIDSDNRTGMVYAVQAQTICIKSKDHQEALSAYKEKRKPNYQGK